MSGDGVDVFRSWTGWESRSAVAAMPQQGLHEGLAWVPQRGQEPRPVPVPCTAGAFEGGDAE